MHYALDQKASLSWMQTLRRATAQAMPESPRALALWRSSYRDPHLSPRQQLRTSIWMAMICKSCRAELHFGELDPGAVV